MSINLIPTEQKNFKRKQRTSRRILKFCQGALALVLIATAALWFINRPLRAKQDTLDGQITTVKAAVATYKSTEDEINTINKKISSIDSTNKANMKTSLILAELARSTPTKAQLKSASISKDTSSLTVAGEAASLREIARFKEKLEASPYFKNVYFSSSTVDSTTGTASFSLTASLEKLQ